MRGGRTGRRNPMTEFHSRLPAGSVVPTAGSVVSVVESNSPPNVVGLLGEFDPSLKTGARLPPLGVATAG